MYPGCVYGGIYTRVVCPVPWWVCTLPPCQVHLSRHARYTSPVMPGTPLPRWVGASLPWWVGASLPWWVGVFHARMGVFHARKGVFLARFLTVLGLF